MAMKKIIIATGNGRIFFVGARYLLSFSKGVILSRWSVDVFIVTKVIAMTKGNEKKKECKDMFRDSFFSEKSSPRPQPLP